MPIAGFDPSLTHFGWVILDVDKDDQESLIDSGVFKTDPRDGLLVQRIIRQRERVRKLLIEKRVSFVAMEAPYFCDFNTELLFALNQHIHEVFLDLGVYVIYIQPVTLKKLSVPYVNPQDVSKNHMIHQAKIELGLQGKRLSEHIADAYFAGKVGRRFYQWNFLKKMRDEDLGEDEKDLFCGKHTFTKGEKKGLTHYKGIIYRENDQFFDYSKQQKRTSHITEEVANE
jgi:Holliday junction resolvasome RuvABC endonuclease subunit